MIIRLKPGYVNIVSSFYAHPDAKAARAGVESQIKEVLKSYPNITAPITFAEPLGVVTFPDSPVHGNTKTCGYSGHFDFQH
jgi:hypothetical protein